MFPARPHPFLLQSVARRGSTLRHALIAPFSSETVYHYRHSAAAPNLFSFSCLGLDLLAFSRFYLWTFSSHYILPCQFILDKLFFRLSNTRNVDTLPLSCWISLETIVELKWWMVRSDYERYLHIPLVSNEVVLFLLRFVYVWFSQYQIFAVVWKYTLWQKWYQIWDIWNTCTNRSEYNGA